MFWEVQRNAINKKTLHLMRLVVRQRNCKITIGQENDS
jgi:hypothetical protein